MNHPSVEKVQSRPEFLTGPWAQVDWHGNLQTLSLPWGCSLRPSQDCYFILSGAKLYFWTYLVTCLTGPVFTEGPGSLWSTLKRCMSDRVAWRCAQLSVWAPRIQVNRCKDINRHSSDIYRPTLGDGDKAPDFLSIPWKIKAQGHIRPDINFRHNESCLLTSSFFFFVVNILLYFYFFLFFIFLFYFILFFKPFSILFCPLCIYLSLKSGLFAQQTNKRRTTASYRVSMTNVFSIFLGHELLRGFS